MEKTISTTKTETTYIIANDAIDDWYPLSIMHFMSGEELYIADECSYDGHPLKLDGTTWLPDYKNKTSEEIKAWACGELGWTPNDCVLEMTTTVTTVTSETTTLC